MALFGTNSSCGTCNMEGREALGLASEGQDEELQVQTGPENEDGRATQAAEEFPILGHVKRPHPK